MRCLTLRREPYWRLAFKGCGASSLQATPTSTFQAETHLRNKCPVAPAKQAPEVDRPETTALSLVRNDESGETQATVAELKQQFAGAAREIESLACAHAGDFKSFEQKLVQAAWALARVALALFFAHRHQRCVVPARLERAGRTFRPAPAQARNLNTFFGVVRYWRTYLREVAEGERRGLYPLDEELGLTGDRMSFGLLAVAARLALKLSFAEARSTLGLFVPSPPSTEVIEQTVLGLGRHTAAWFESAPAPSGDGDALVIQIDGKGAPTATDSELARRRGKRKKQPKRCTKRCQRHRGRAQRGRYGEKPRRQKGDKSKNAKMATMVVMYTLRRGENGERHGPINVWRYASFAPKRHAFAVAQREVNKRGFGPDSGKLVQLVTDGDNDLACYAKEFLPHALHSIDVMHVIEKLWSAGEALYREGSRECTEWAEDRKDELYAGKADAIVALLKRRLDQTPRTGPGNKGKRQRLHDVMRYIEKRLDRLRYDRLIAEDLELGSGAVEGAVKNIIGKRCDHGGMRWIKERVEALVQLRCIEANCDFDRFAEFAHRRIQAQALSDAIICRIQSSEPAALPTFGVAA